MYLIVEQCIVALATLKRKEVETMVALLIVILLALVVWRFGTDSRDGRDWSPRSS